MKLPSNYVFKVYMKHKRVSCLNLGPIPKISYIHANILKLKKFKSKALLVPGILDKGYLMYNSYFYCTKVGFLYIFRFYRPCSWLLDFWNIQHPLSPIDCNKLEIYLQTFKKIYNEKKHCTKYRELNRIHINS